MASKLPETKLQNEKGLKLYCRYWNEDEQQEKTDIKGLVLIVHGYCEHCLFYTELAELLKKQGFYVFSHDHVGHGQSDGDRAHIHSFDEYVQDVLFHVDKVKQEFPGKPTFLLGHSMGGTISVLTAMSRPDFFKGVVLIAPLIVPDKKAASPWKVAAGKMAAKVLPQMIIAKIDPKNVTREEENVKKYIEDPLVFHGGIKCRWGVAMLDALMRIKSSFPEIQWPFLILHGTKDALCELEGSQLMYDKASSTDKKLKIFDGAYHQLHKELPEVKNETFDLISSWLNSHA
ncbi:monoglyceride lipase-like [Mya arenaria]|uniref:monoglyceride lipase-like n=1 Tax=Mya arenaria TaxID=6604 RepID=UPI0022E29B96|nr:monoglyceride lipase-like [Mya arenaria]